MTQIGGGQIVQMLDGGSANKGQDVFFKLKVDEGGRKRDYTLFITHDRMPELISHLITYAGLARNTRLGRNPMEEADGTFASGHALGLVASSAGRSVSESGVGIVTLQFDGGQGRKLNTHVATERAALEQLRKVC